jgi:hypothetical protein
MYAAEFNISDEVFRLSGQSDLDAWSLRDQLVSSCARYSRWLTQNIHLTMQSIRDLADSAYFGNDCLVAARQHGATPLHGIKKNARHFSKPETLYQKMASFWQHWPNRAAELYGKRNHAETAFSMIQRLFGYRLRCRAEISRKNEVQAKISMFNLFLLARKEMEVGI